MTAKSTKEKTKLYSEGLEGTLQLKVKRITARTGDSFRTKPFQATFLENDNSQDYIEWREAEKDPDSSLWSVYHYKTEPGVHMDDEGRFSHETGLTRKTIQEGICFFDALYTCALYEASEENENLGLKAVKSKNINGFSNKHYKEFAKNEGILFDQKTRLPIPVGNGKILIKDDCVLELGAKETVNKSKGNLSEITQEESDTLKKASTEIVPAVTDAETDELMDSLNSTVVLAKNEAEIKNNHIKSINALSKVKRNFEIIEDAKGKRFTLTMRRKGDVAKYEFLGTSAQKAALVLAIPAVILSVPWLLATAGVIGFLGVVTHGMNCMFENRNPLKGYKDNGPTFPQARMKREIKRLRKVADKQQNNDVKLAYKKFADTVELGTYKLSARHAFKRASTGKSVYNDYRLKKTFNDLIKCCGRMGYTKDEIMRLLAKLKENANTSNFEKERRNLFNEAVNELETTLEKNKTLEIKQLKALPAPKQ